MTQVHALLSYIVAKFPEKKLAGNNTIRDKQRFDQWLAFLNGDLHPAYAPIFRPDRFTKDDDEASLANVKSVADTRLRTVFQVLNNHLEGKQYMLGDKLSCVDPFAYILTSWLHYTGVHLDEFPALKKYFERMQDVPAIIQARKEQGIQD